MSDFRVADWLARELGSAGRGAVLRNLVHEHETMRCEYEVPGQPGVLVVICRPDNGIAGPDLGRPGPPQRPRRIADRPHEDQRRARPGRRARVAAVALIQPGAVLRSAA